MQDLDLLRRAVGHDKLNYLGFSYGTHIGSVYAEMFPDKVGRMVLDGVSDLHLSDEMYLTTSAVGLESTFNDFFRWCNTTAKCALCGRDQAAIFDAVVAAAENGTLHAQKCSGGPCNHKGTARVWEFILNSESQLHDYNAEKLQENWYSYAEGLKAAFDYGNGSYFVQALTTANSSSLDFQSTLSSSLPVQIDQRDDSRLKISTISTRWLLSWRRTRADTVTCSRGCLSVLAGPSMPQIHLMS